MPVQIPTDWATLSGPSSGTISSSFSVIIDANTYNLYRSVDVIVTSAAGTQTITIQQDPTTSGGGGTYVHPTVIAYTDSNETWTIESQICSITDDGSWVTISIVPAGLYSGKQWVTIQAYAYYNGTLIGTGSFLAKDGINSGGSFTRYPYITTSGAIINVVLSRQSDGPPV